MQFVKKVFDFYLNSSIHVALAAVCLSWLTLIEYQIPCDMYVLNFIFFATIMGYNFVKFFGLAQFHHRSLSSWLKFIQIFSMISFLIMGYFATQLQLKTVFYLMVFAVVTFLYAIPFLPKKFYLDKQQNLRNISGLKVHVIALVWSGVTVLVPLINNDRFVDTTVIWAFIQRFVLVLALMLPFEIRDMQFDSIKLATIPQRIGIKNTKIMGVVLVLLFFGLEFFMPEKPMNKLLIQLAITLILIMSILLARKNQGKYYSGFWVESIPILWLLLTLLFG
ncbi:hypothetical protein BZARG_908 [Bizionia argentinensis JUB59]|uniref:Prenyltransferase n=1 Tax=Bizionia argentinensis JUB59 TaxID=1046627 RepID=G2EBN0_9FLAO|nr:membrane protein [Bizionia argentinensis]EGV44150.2 hypothetical protein BZARG_908 [Bizionia argentinensis JUB59]